MIVTFYSFKGGVGRSMAVANVADILARQGLRVLMVDFDLEAPGLEQYFQINHSAARRNPGLLDLLLAYKRSMSVAGGPSGYEPEFKRLDAFIGPVYPTLSGGGCLHLLAAGQREPREQLDRYASNLRTFDWQDFYFNWEGELFFEWLRTALVPGRYDLVLVDSRTGVTEMGGICTYQLADAIVMLSAANHQNRQGTLNVAADFLSPPVQVARRDRPLEILAVPARVEQKDSALLEQFVQEFERQFAAYLPDRLKRASMGFRELLIPYEPAYAFEERVLSDPTRAAERKGIAGAFERLAGAVRLLMATAGTVGVSAAHDEPAAAAPLQYDAAKRFATYGAFVAYRAADQAAVDSLAGAIRFMGSDAFLDRQELVAGEDWRARTEQAIFHSRVCLLCYGRDISARDSMTSIASLAASRDRPVIPVLLPGADRTAATALLPPSLASTEWLDLSRGVDSAQVVEALKRFLASSEPAAAGAGRGADDAPAAAVNFGAPYPGLRHFTEADAGFLFGHEDIQQMVHAALGAHRVAVVTGPSACGKTSLVEAGVLPALRAARRDESWAYQRVVPERAPATLLDHALAELGKLSCPHRLLFVDQLERILRHATPDEESAFFARLDALRRDPGGPLLVIGVREVRLAALKPLAPAGLLDGPHCINVPPMSASQLRAAIEQPAARAGLAFEPGLADRIVADWGQDQRFLPFMQSVLHELWTRRREGFLTNRSYDDIADPIEALAEEAYAARPDLQQAASRVIPRLVALCGNLTPPGLTCEPAELRLADVPAEHVHEVLWHLVDRRLLYASAGPGGEPRVAPAFTRRQWARAAAWHDSDADFLHWLNSLHFHRLEWLRTGKDDGALLSGALLAQAVEQSTKRPHDFTALETEFITRSKEFDLAAERRWTRYRRGAIAAGLVGLLLIGGLWISKREAVKDTQVQAANQAAQAENNARTSAALIEAGDSAAADGSVQVAIDNYSEALKLAPDNTTALLRRAAMLDQRGDFKGAIADITRVIDQSESNKTAAGLQLLADAHLARGLSHLHDNQPEKALADLTESASHNPKDHRILAGRAAVLERLGRDQEALTSYSESLAIAPDPDVSFSRGVLLEKLGDREKATADFRTVAEAPGASATVKQAARARLNNLGEDVTAAPAAAKPRVFAHIVEKNDTPVVRRMLAALGDGGFDPQGIEVVKERVSAPEIRYFNKEDERPAQNARTLAESAIAAAGFNVRLSVNFVGVRGRVAPGTIEIWLPSLSEGLSTLRNRAYQMKY